MSTDKKVLGYRAEGYADVTPYLSLSNCLSAIDFYKRALHATELVVMKADMGGGEKCMHAELQIGDSKIMLSEDFCAGGGEGLSEAKPAAAAEETEKAKSSAPEGEKSSGAAPEGESESMLNPYVRHPLTHNTTSTTFVIYVKNVDEAFAHAVKEGAKPVRKPADQFYGDRSGVIRDPFGHVWCLQTHIEDVSPEEMKKRMAAMTAKAGPKEKRETDTNGDGAGPEKKQKVEKKENMEADKE
jgi:PhnB protein